MRYYWVMPDAVSQKSPRAIRVMGEKGERYEEVYTDETIAALKLHPAIQEARLARQAALRKEAQRLAKQLRESGKEPLVAYEKAWTEVYRKNWLNAGGMNESCRLDDMLARLASENEELNLTESEQQWLLEALLEDDDRLESEAGLELLRRLAAQLRRMGYGNLDKTLGVNDELMKRFAEAMRHMPDSMNAFRDALFKTNRGNVGNYTLRGYCAPWGIRVGGGMHYHQAPLQVETTEGSGNTQLPAEIPLTVGSGQSLTGSAIVEIPGATDDFLATSPEQSEKKEKDEEEDDTLTQEEDESGQVAAAPAMMMRSFSMRSSAPATVASTQGDDATAPEAVVSDAPDILSWPSGSSVKFEDTANRAKEVQIDAGGVVADTVDITGSGYSFTGGNLVVTDRLSVTSSAGFGITLDVGANRIQGGTLENVQMLVTGEIHRPVTDDYVTVHNLITSADGNNAAVLRNVALHAGTSTEYATLHKIAFAGESSLTGFVTFEKTQATGDMSVAAGGTLTLKNLTFDLRGVSMGEKTLFVIEDGGTLEGWNADNVHFVYSGVKLNSAAVNLSKGDGKIVLSADHNGHLYWNGADDNMWNISSANWSSSGDGTGREAFTALSNVHFGGGNADKRVITVTQDMVVADLYVTDGGYSFSGARVAVLGDASFTHEKGAVTFNDHLVVQGGLTTAGLGCVELQGGATIVKDATFNNLTTTIGGDMTVGGKLTVSPGDATTAGSLTISGNVTANEMDLVVNGGSASVSGNLTTTITENKRGSITIDGTAEQRYTGIVTAGKLTVNTTKKDVFFSRLHVDELTVGEGATVHVRTSADSVAVSASEFPVINLCGTLALDAQGTYNHDYQVNVLSNAAKLIFGAGSTIDGFSNVSLGKKGLCIDGGEQTLHNLQIEARSNSATVEEIKNLGSLTVTTGAVTVKSATDAVHGKLILDGGKLKLESDNIMASGSGEILLENGGRLDIGTTTQTLSANNEVFLSGTSSITCDADGPGLLLGDGICINYADSGNSIETKLTVEKGVTLNSTLAGSSLEISGLISGSGEIKLTGPGSVGLSSANTGFTGQVTVQQGSTLTLQNADALSNADVVLNEGATLALDAPDTVKLNALTLSSGSTLAISSIVGTDGLSAQDAALQVGTFNIGSNALTLNVHFEDTLDTMTTYNIMSGLSPNASINNLSFVVKHNGVNLSDSQYTLGVHNGVLYIYTMMGNVWNGEGTGASAKIWSSTGGFANWSEGKYNENETLGYTAAIFRDLTQTSETVTVQGPVNPGDIYFTAVTTSYTLDSDGAGCLADGTNIHKIGKAAVSLNLTNNATADTALGNVDVQAGSLILESALAVKGTVTVEKVANLKLKDGSGGLTMFAKEGDSLGCYTVSSIASAASTEEDAFATLSGVTMDAAGIRGTKDVYNAAIQGGIDAAEINASNLLVQGNAELQYLILKDFEAAGNVTLSDVTLTSSSSSTATTLTGVTIGSGVEVDASGSYILSGNLTFDGKLTNNGFVTLDNVTSLEIGKIEYDEVAADGKAQYVYQFISSTKENGFSSQALTAEKIFINGLNLGSGLKDKDGVKFTDNGNGSITLSIYDGTVSMPQWDERWGKTEKAPSLSRRYAGNDDYVELAAGNDGDTTYYRYSSIVSADNAAKVNGGNAIVATLSSDVIGEHVVGALVKSDTTIIGGINQDWYVQHNAEVWIEDHSSCGNIIGGLDNPTASWAKTYFQTAATHVLVDSDFKKDPDKIVLEDSSKFINDRSNWAKQFIIGGSCSANQGISWANLAAESFVTVKDGEIYTIFGGSCSVDYLDKDWPYKIAANQYGTSHVFVEGGRIGEIFAGGCHSTLTGTQVMEDGRIRAVEMVLTGGTFGGDELRVFGGGERGIVNGDIYVRMEGSAKINSRLVGGSNAGTVNGNIVLDLISGEAFRVDAAGLGWYIVDEWGGVFYDPADIKGDVQVNLYSGFELGIGAEGDLSSGIYGGREQSNQIVLLNGDDGTVHTSTLHFAEGEKYELGFIGGDGYTTSEASHIVTGFDRFVMEENAHVVLGLGKFDIDMNVNKKLHIEGKGVVEVIGHGANLGRNIQLEKDATLKISTSVIGASGSEDDRTITVTDGSTIDFSGAPAKTGYTGDSVYEVYAGLGFKVVIAGNGVDGKGALYKGKYDGPYDLNAEGATSTANRIVLPNVKLQDDASVGVEAGETLYMNAYALGESNLDLAGYTFTKLGAGNFITRSVKTTPGTILVQLGTFGFDKTSTAAQTDMVLAAGAKLKLDTAGAADLELRSLIGSGMVFLNGQKLTLNTEKDSAYYSEYMVDAIDKPQAYDQFSETTGFAYAVFSGLISDSGKLAKAGSGVQYISGSSNTYTGGTLLQDGRLYLLGTSEASGFSKDESTVASGVVGKSDIVWASDAAELYLGHGTRIYNNGTTNVQGGSMTIGVEGVTGGVLEDFVGIHGTVTMGGVEYVEIDTYNLKAIDVDALYEDGSSYVAGTDIDHDKKLLVKKTDRGALADFIGVRSSELKDDVVYVEIDTHNLKSIAVNGLYEVNTLYEAGTDIDHDKKLLVKESDQWKLGADVSILGTVTKGGERYVEIDTHNLETIAVNGLYEVNTLYEAGTDIDHNKKLLVKESDWGAMDDFISIRGTVALGGVKYVEIDTHNLKSIAVNALYADGTAYVAGTDIDRNKMLLVKMDDWETAKTKEVTSLSDNGYNEAVYSGTLSHSDNVTAELRKVGMGTLVLDQSSSYTGGTKVEAGTLRLRGWATLGSNVKNNTATVQKGATLMFTHNGGFANETTSAANDIVIDGTGDARWEGNSATDGGTAALISAVGPEVTFTLSGDISGSGNVRHSGDGTLVLNGDSSYTGGTVITRGVVEVQSATGLGATASGKGAVTVEHDADLRVTVERDYKDAHMVTTLAADTNYIQGDVYVQGTADTERILHMDGNGYNAVSTTLDANGTLLINGAAINGTAVKAESGRLTGSGKVVVSDASASGTSASFDSMKDYTGDFRVEGDKTSIRVGAGSLEQGSIYVAGQQSSVHIGGHVYIAAGESLHLRSTGAAGTDAGSALLASGGVVGVASGAVFSVSNAKTEFAYNLSELKDASSVTLGDLISPAGDVSGEYYPVGADVGTYTGRFDASIAVNKQAVGAVQAAGGLTLAGGATYETLNAHTSLLGGSLTLDVLANNQITLHTSFDIDIEKYTDEVQLVLFSDVGSVNFVLDGELAEANTGVYYTRADRYLTGCDYVDEESVLVYDSQAGVVYLQTSVLIPEPTTTALSLLALSGLLARRRRRD